MNAAQPLCAGCKTPLPWEDVDRIAGNCRACGAPFDFTAPPAAPLPRDALAHVDARMEADRRQILTEGVDVPFPSAPLARPAAVELVMLPMRPATYREGQTPGGFEASWRKIGPRGRMLLPFAVVWDASVVFFFAVMPHGWRPFLLLHALAAVLVTFAAVNALRARTRVVASGDDVLAEGRGASGPFRQSLPLREIARFICVETSIQTGSVSVNDGPAMPIRHHVYHVTAVLHDGRVSRLVSEIGDRDVALYVTQLLQQRLEVRS